MAGQARTNATADENLSVDEGEPLSTPISRTENILKYAMLFGCFLMFTSASIFLYVTLDKFDNPNLLPIVKVQYGIITGLCIMEVICAFVGLYGFYYDKMKYMYLFLGIIGLVFICQLVELATSVLLFVKEKSLINKLMDYHLQSYDGSEENVFTMIQYRDKCCGIHSHKDWSMNQYFQDGIALPRSCCDPALKLPECLVAEKKFYQTGCRVPMQRAQRRHLALNVFEIVFIESVYLGYFILVFVYLRKVSARLAMSTAPVSTSNTASQPVSTQPRPATT